MTFPHSRQETIMADSSTTTPDTAQEWGEAFFAGFRSPDTRRAYGRDLGY